MLNNKKSFVVELYDRLDVMSSPDVLRELLLELAEVKAPNICLDLSHVTHIDSAGIGILIFVKREVEKIKKLFSLCNIPEAVQKTINLLDLNKYF